MLKFYKKIISVQLCNDASYEVSFVRKDIIMIELNVHTNTQLDRGEYMGTMLQHVAHHSSKLFCPEGSAPTPPIIEKPF